MKTLKISVVLLTVLLLGSCKSTIENKIALKDKTWKEGIVSEEFIFETAPYPSCHAATIAETTNGDSIASWFGGTNERDPDVGIWVSKRKNGKWT
ncbi:MAG TPA: hypothetical protein PKV22_01785, partial [Paludibacteraceae bacterium]|nr:hypothetical protein [Paludibacteraceae bacterium]